MPVTAPATTPAPTISELIVSTAPAGLVLQPDNVADTGPTNLVKAVNDDNSPDARAALLSAGFEQGYQRQWAGTDANGNTTNQDFLFLYRFATPAGAQAYAQHWRLALLNTNQGSPIQSFTPPFIPGANGLSVQDPQLASTGVVLFAKGQYAVQALVIGGVSVDESGPATQLAYEQYQLLP